jgi:hypothetical protein
LVCVAGPPELEELEEDELAVLEPDDVLEPLLDDTSVPVMA